ncbi:hypothetical protein [Nocardiopsis sp. CNT312]|uniref:hypothetical protein n=1 Tax=Nocardiopsis sp. CNT312 TaxID=1137268 RepID=UPI00048E40E2|nr:hypothetical protein [Nocardiopsis sp. CNT312]
MAQTTRTCARTLVLAAATAGFISLGAGVSLAEPGTSGLGPAAGRVLSETVAPAMGTVAPGGFVPAADSALQELQRTAREQDKPAPDLSAPLRAGEGVGSPALADTVAAVQDGTGLDGDPSDTVGHAAGDALTGATTDTGTVVEGTLRGAGSGLEDSASQALPSTVGEVDGLKRDVLPSPLLPGPGTVRQSAPAPALADLTSGTGIGDLTSQVSDATGLGLPRVAEGLDTGTVEALGARVAEGDLLSELDLSDPVSIEGGTPQGTAGPASGAEGLTSHPTFLNPLPGSTALPAVS